MDQVQSITNPIREKGKHLTFENRVVIQTRLRDKWSIRRIARELNCSPNTVRNELERGKVLLYNHVTRHGLLPPYEFGVVT